MSPAVLLLTAAVVLEGAGASLALPPDWSEATELPEGRTSVGALPSVAPGADGEVAFIAVGPGGASLAVVAVDAPLTVDESTLDRVAVSAPDALRAQWGLDFQVTWAGLGPVGDRVGIEVAGRTHGESGRSTVQLTLVPSGSGHLLVLFRAPEAADDAEATRQRAALASLLSGLHLEPVRARPEVDTRYVGAGIGAGVGLVLALWLRRRKKEADPSDARIRL